MEFIVIYFYTRSIFVNMCNIFEKVFVFWFNFQRGYNSNVIYSYDRNVCIRAYFPSVIQDAIRPLRLQSQMSLSPGHKQPASLWSEDRPLARHLRYATAHWTESDADPDTRAS